ncbi:MAG: hypothetical protein KKE20_02965 [Nanoarchaeota archaeon]|nr:hypothetical protein [Nanoarchaeota archaeon]
MLILEYLSFYIHKKTNLHESMLQNLTGRQQQKTYELTRGDVVFQWIDIG